MLRLKKYLQKSLKITLWILGGLFTLILLLLIVIQIPSVQLYAKDKAVVYLQDKIKTKVKIEHLSIGFPKNVILQGVYFEDQKKDTLLAGEKLAVDISMFQLLRNKVEINSIALEGITANISRSKDGVFNFDYITKAFASPPKTEDKNSTPMTFSVESIALDRIRLRYKDASANNELNTKINHFQTTIKKFDLEKMAFDVPKIKINGLTVLYKQGKSAPSNTKIDDKNSNPTTPLQLKLGVLDFGKIKIAYADENSKINTQFYFKKLLATIDKFDLNNQFAILESVELTGVEGELALDKNTTQKVEKVQEVAATTGWEIKIYKTALQRIDFKFNNNNAAPVAKGIDYNHLHLRNFNMDLESLNYNPENISGDLTKLTIKDKSGLNIQSLKGNFFYGKKNSFIKNLYLKTPNTELRDEIQVGYPSLEALSKNPGDLSVIARLKKSRLGAQDILILAPALASNPPFKTNPKTIILIDGAVKGKLKNLVIPSLEVSGIGSTKLAASGKIHGLPDMEKAVFDLKIKEFKSTAKDINSFVPKGVIPNNIQLPARLSLNGTFKGTIQSFKTMLNLNSSMGIAKVNASLDQRRKNAEQYQAQATFVNFDLGKLLKNDSIGKISATANVKGTGFNPKTATAALNANVVKAYFNKYNYKNIALKGSIKKGLFQATASAKDPNLNFTMLSSGSFRDKYPTGKIKLNMDIADLEKLNLHAGPLKLRGFVDADIQSANLDFLNGTIVAQNIEITNAKEQFVIDSIQVTAKSTAQSNVIELKAPFMNAAVNGRFSLSQLGTALSQSIAAYYTTNPVQKKKNTAPQHFDFKVALVDHPILFQLLPDLKSIEPIALSGRYNSVNDTIIMQGTVPKMVYAGVTVTNAALKVDTQNQTLLYEFLVDDIQNSALELPHTELKGNVKNNTVEYLLQLKDKKDKERYLLTGELVAINGNQELSLDSNRFVLNYEPWEIANSNRIRFGKKGLLITDFNLNKNGSGIQIQSEPNTENAPLQLEFKDFDISTITSFVEKNDLQLSGKINGAAKVTINTPSPLFTSDLDVQNLTFKKDTVGNLKIKIDNAIANQYNANIEISGQENQAELKGIYNALNSTFDLNIDLKALQLKSIQGFTLGNLTESNGFLSGQLNLKGNTSQPELLGEVQFNTVGFTVKPLNAKFQQINDKITFASNTIILNRFTIKDEKDNDLIIDGKIDISNLTNMGFNLAIDAKNFKAVNSKAKDNDLYYGELYLDNQLQISGTLDSPQIEGTVKINKDTKFNIVLPQSDPSIADREGIVEFIDQDKPKAATAIALQEFSSSTEVKGINASVNIEVDKEAELSIIIDKANGDFLKLKGEAQLNGGIDPSGKTSLTGRYELSEGSYEMNFNAIKRKFDIKSGSYILWTGEPTTADINITAVYKTEAAPIDLVNDQLGDVSASVRNTYKEKIPFETELKMNGELLQPTISFDIVLPDGNNNVATEIINSTQAKLAQIRTQQDELNKQVFALLLLNRFIGENPFASENGGTSVSALARESASKLLSQQLNNLAGDLIQGVELNFDLNTSEDFTTGQRENKTDLSVGISKKLLNDRLKVTVGSSFGLEGSQQANQNASNIAGDVALDYQISKDGRYKARAYRVNKYQVALQGEVIETGVSFVITMDYNKFSELFKKSQAPKDKSKKATPKK